MGGVGTIGLVSSSHLWTFWRQTIVNGYWLVGWLMSRLTSQLVRTIDQQRSKLVFHLVEHLKQNHRLWHIHNRNQWHYVLWSKYVDTFFLTLRKLVITWSCKKMTLWVEYVCVCKMNSAFWCIIVCDITCLSYETMCINSTSSWNS